MREWLRTWKCWLLNYHPWEWEVINLENSSDAFRPVTVIFRQCRKCGKSELKNIYA